jgi:ribonuclease G
VKSEETIAIESERRLRELVALAGPDGPEAYLVRMNPKVTAYYTSDGARMLRGLEQETGRTFHFTGSEGLPLDHFAIVESGARAEIEEQSVPFREGEEVHVDIVEPHMYSEDDAVAKVDGYLIEVRDAIPYVGEKMLVRIEQAGRTAARAVLVEVAEEAAAASEERRKERERAARRPPAKSAAARSRARKPATPEEQAVEALTDHGGVHAGTGPGAAEESDEDAARPKGRRRSRTKADAAAPAAEDDAQSDAAEPGDDGDAPDSGDDALQSKPRRRGRRGGRRRSRAKAGADAAEVSEASE